MNIAQRIEHTNLKANATEHDIELICNAAVDNGFRAVCVNSRFIKFAKSLVEGSMVKVVSVVDFPLGASSHDIRLNFIDHVCYEGADEVDIVWSISDLVAGEYGKVAADLGPLVEAAGQTPVKVIVETAFLEPVCFSLAYGIVKASGAKYIKTSTGLYLQDGRALDAVKSWSEESGLLIKASGGIINFEIAKEFLAAGASVLGTSSGLSIVRESKKEVL